MDLHKSGHQTENESTSINRQSDVLVEYFRSTCSKLRERMDHFTFKVVGGECCCSEKQQTKMTLSLWFLLVNKEGVRLASTKCVQMEDNATVADLQAAVKEIHEDGLLHNVDPSDLNVYTNKATYEATDRKLLEATDKLCGLGEDEDCALVVVVYFLLQLVSLLAKRPAIRELVKIVVKRIKLSVLTQFDDLTVDESEFQLDNLSTKQASDVPIVATPGLHAFWGDLGEFPRHYFVRMEEVMLWKVVKRLISSTSKGRIVVVGSSGVGKSCFLIRVAFYLACVEKKKVLLIRRVKTCKTCMVAVFFDGQGSYSRVTNLSPNDIYVARAEANGAIVLLDGYRQDEADSCVFGLSPFDILATSSYYDAKHDDLSHIVVLPAWRHDAELLQYAKLTDWVIETGLSKTKQLSSSTWSKLVKTQYFYTGGSMRAFCMSRKELGWRVMCNWTRVDSNKPFQLVHTYGDYEDRVWRHFITDCKEEMHYYDSRFWQLSVDSGFALHNLGRMAGVEKLLEVYKYAKSIGASFEGAAYQQLLHNAVHQADKPVMLKMREGSKYDKLEIRCLLLFAVAKMKIRVTQFWRDLARRDTGMVTFFPCTNAVSVCQAFSSGSEESEMIVAYLQVTIRPEKKFKADQLRRLNAEVDKNPQLKDLKRVLVVVVPDDEMCNSFKLRDAPDPNTFTAMISCFDPNQL